MIDSTASSRSRDRRIILYIQIGSGGGKGDELQVIHSDKLCQPINLLFFRRA